jgi:hypothetical protein
VSVHLAPFHEATVELSEDKRVSGSKVIPLLKKQEAAMRSTKSLATELGEHLIKLVREKLHTLQSSSNNLLPTSTIISSSFENQLHHIM